jgi:glycosyltransferase involved in cell wall biosynthesis
VTSLPEVGGDKAFYCDPLDVTSIAHWMDKLVNATFTQEELLTQAAQFSWDKTAEKVWEVIENVMS